MFVWKAAVVGAGTMGGEIAQLIAAAGVPVMLKDVEQKFVDLGLEKAREVTHAQLGALVAKERLTQEQADASAAEILARIQGTTSYAGFGDVDFAIEAVPERMGIKQSVFAELDAATPGHAILCSNTSSLSISEMAQATGRPDKVVGFHFFYPAATMRLIEVIEGDETSAETAQAAANFAQQLKKMAIRCSEVPGFIVNRVLNSAVGEVWREQEARALSISAIDKAVAEARVAPMGPFFLVDLLGLDTALHVAEHLAESYGSDSFYVHEGMRALVQAGDFGAKSGKGFYENGKARSGGSEDFDPQELADRYVLKALVESCMLLDEGVANTRDIDLGMMAGSGMIPPPFARADEVGLDEVLARLERAEQEWGERYAPPMILRRLVAQGRLGKKSGQGFFPYPSEAAAEQEGPVKLERRGEVAIAWLDNPPANSISPETVRALRGAWDSVQDARVLLIASANPMLFCAGADIKAFTKMDAAGGSDLLREMHSLLREMERSAVVTIAAINAAAFGGGCELAMGCDIRIAAQSATFGQPEINLGIIPGFGGTQRLPRLVGASKALEMNLVGEAVSAEEAWEFGLVNQVVPDHELLDTALAWARKLAGQAPIAVRKIKEVSGAADLDEGIEAEKQAFGEIFASEDAREGIAAFLGKRSPKWSGR
ncbi:MAG: 3-hydroxyacyl-CoA dehydrogenase/enoyl-CoA hydratase family protein [Solirubrobacteraceae bacterium]